MIAGRYTLEREIGRGGMGAVWLARDEVLGRQVALKRVGLVPGGSSPDLERAEREAKLAAKLNHPHVVAVFDFVGDGDSQWLVMEYVVGVTLSDLTRERGGLDPDEAARLIQQAAEALAAAHEAGIVHRDVKPSNILVTSDGTAKLTDFGIARALADSTLTQTGMVTGSPAYLAPEVASGRTATSASDVWSLGATLFHALAGRPPYDVGENLMGALYRIVHEEPPRLPNAGWLAPVLESTMATDPDLRWSMASVRDFLAQRPREPATLAGPPLRTLDPEPEPTRVIAPSPEQPTRRRVLPLLAALVAVLLLAGGGYALLNDDPETKPPTTRSGGTRTPSPSTPSTSAGATAAGMTAFVRDYLGTVTGDPSAAWGQLTPAFQRTSGGFKAYRQFWGPIRSATIDSIDADPENLTVHYTVTYDGPRSRPGSDDVTLELEYDDGRYLIAGEPSG